MRTLSDLWLRLRLLLGFPQKLQSKRVAFYRPEGYTLTAEDEAFFQGYHEIELRYMGDGFYTAPQFDVRYEPEYRRTAIYMSWEQCRRPRGYGLYETKVPAWEDVTLPSWGGRP